MTQNLEEEISQIVDKYVHAEWIENVSSEEQYEDDNKKIKSAITSKILSLIDSDKKELVEACKMAKNQLLNCSYMFDMPTRFKESFNQCQQLLKQVITTADLKNEK